MKYSKKQINQAFIDWNTHNRLNPSTVETDEKVNSTDVKTHSKELTQALIYYINKQ
jgi:hypothetical protein